MLKYILMLSVCVFLVGCEPSASSAKKEDAPAPAAKEGEKAGEPAAATPAPAEDKK